MTRSLPTLILCAAATLALLGVLRSFSAGHPAVGPEPWLGAFEARGGEIPDPGPGADRYQQELEAENGALRSYISEHPRGADEARVRMMRNLRTIAAIKQARAQSPTEAARRLPRPPMP